MLILATACIFCHFRFGQAISEYPYELFDVIEIVGKALGIEYEDKLAKYRNYHNPERVVRETMEYIEASPYSVEEVSEVLQRFLP